MDNKESYCSVESDGTANGTVVRDQAGNVLKRVSEINIRAKVGEPFVTAQIEVLGVRLDLGSVVARIDESVIKLSENGSPQSDRIYQYINKQVSNFMDEHNLRWEGSGNGCGSALLEALLIDLVESCIKGLAEKEYEKEVLKEDENE